MLEKFKKLLGSTEAKAPVIEAVAPAATELLTLKLDASDLTAELSQMRTEFETGIAALTADFQGAQSALAEMTANFEAAQAALNALTAEKADMAVKAEAAKFAVRKEKVVSAIGTEKADGLMLATQGLDDAAFDAVVSALAGSVDAEAKTGLFKEVGVNAEADTTKIVAESSVMKLIKQKKSTRNQ